MKKTTEYYKPNVILNRIDENKSSLFTSKGSVSDYPIKGFDGLSFAYALKPHQNWIGRFKFSPDGQFVASGSDDCKIFIWKFGETEFYSVLIGHTTPITDIAWSPDSKYLAASSEESGIIVWDINNGDIIVELDDVSVFLYCLDWSPCGKYLCIGSEIESIYVYDTKQWAIINCLDAHKDYVNNVTFSPCGKKLASCSGDATICVWDTESWILSVRMRGHAYDVNSIVWSSDGKKIYSGGTDRTIRVWDSHTGKEETSIEGHTEFIRCVEISPNGELLVSKSIDQSVRFWDTKTYQCVGKIKQKSSSNFGGLAFSPNGSTLITRDDVHGLLVFLNIDYAKIFGLSSVADTIKYTTAKIALVGDSGVGKTSLGWRLKYNEFIEHSSTHGQQFWVVEDLCLKKGDRTECETVLWDFAGQPDYRLVHSLFLEDIDLALVLFDSSNRENPLGGAEFWVKQLRQGRTVPRSTILVASRIDRGYPTITDSDLRDFCQFNEISGGYVLTSSKDNIGIIELKEKIRGHIPWSDIPATVTNQTFKDIKSFSLDLKENNDSSRPIVSLDNLLSLINEKYNKKFISAEVLTAVKHLENHGYVKILKSSTSKTVLLLRPDILINLASSCVIEARKNLKGLGILEEKSLLRNDYDFEEIKILSKECQTILLDCVADLFISNNLCFRETFNDDTFLVFPSLINEKPPLSDSTDFEDDVSYRISGDIEHIYPSLVVMLGYTNVFSRQNQWKGKAQYQVDEKYTCGFTQLSEHKGELELSIYYGKDTTNDIRSLFQGLFERILKRKEVSIDRYKKVICDKCCEKQERAAVKNQLAKSKLYLHCCNCGNKINLEPPDKLFEFGTTDKLRLKSEQDVADKRSGFETSIVLMKSHIRDRGSAHSNPTCFISYAWGDPIHERWVLELAKCLRNCDIDVIFDRWHNTPGTSISKFIERISSSAFVVCVGTRRYLEKYNTPHTDPVVDAEIRMINTRIRKRKVESEKIIPLLLEGQQTSSFPPLFEDSVYIDFTNDKLYFQKMIDLLLTLHRINIDDPIVERIFDKLD